MTSRTCLWGHLNPLVSGEEMLLSGIRSDGITATHANGAAPTWQRINTGAFSQLPLHNKPDDI